MRTVHGEEEPPAREPRHDRGAAAPRATTPVNERGLPRVVRTKTETRSARNEPGERIVVHFCEALIIGESGAALRASDSFHGPFAQRARQPVDAAQVIMWIAPR